MTFAVVLEPEAVRQIDEIDLWWRENRRSSPELFRDELSAALDAIADAPLIGIPYRRSSVPKIRRVLLRSSRYHVYYEFGGTAVVVLAVWSALRRRPKLLR